MKPFISRFRTLPEPLNTPNWGVRLSTQGTWFLRAKHASINASRGKERSMGVGKLTPTGLGACASSAARSAGPWRFSGVITPARLGGLSGRVQAVSYQDPHSHIRATAFKEGEWAREKDYKARLLLRGWRLRGAKAAGVGEPRAWPHSSLLTVAASVSASASEAWTSTHWAAQEPVELRTLGPQIRCQAISKYSLITYEWTKGHHTLHLNEASLIRTSVFMK